jgi:hydroxymethylpyrimidine/phosphomethylpyrimidine kinase
VLAIEACKAAIVRRQMEAVFAELRPAAIKIGMLYSVEIIRAVADFLTRHRKIPLVVDPVMISTSGARLLEAPAIQSLKTRLLPIAMLVTPNLDEAAALTGRKLESIEDMRSAARQLHQKCGCAALVKGGHLRGATEAADIFFDGEAELLLSAPFIKGVRTHGTGCFYSAAITAFLSKGEKLPKAVTRAKEYISQAICQSNAIGKHRVLNAFWNAKR